MTHARSIAVAQTIPIRGDINANVEQHVRLAHVAAEEKSQVLVFPEMSLTGYELDLASDRAFLESDPRLAPLVEVAAKESIILIVGAPVRVGSWLCIGAFVVSPDRSVGLYTKHHLGAFPASACCDGIVPPAEATIFQAGDRNPLIRFGENVAAVAVCADAGRPSHPQQAADRGAKAYLASMFVIPSEFEREMVNLQAYAVKHSMAVAFANYGGPSGSLASAGRSAIWSDSGELLVQLDSSGTGVAIAVETDHGWRAKSMMLDVR